METDLQILQDDRVKYYRMAESNVRLQSTFRLPQYSLRNKVTEVRIIFKDLSLDYFVLSETKLDESFPTAQFPLEDYEIRS